jgi:hypothetical protein
LGRAMGDFAGINALSMSSRPMGAFWNGPCTWFWRPEFCFSIWRA